MTGRMEKAQQILLKKHLAELFPGSAVTECVDDIVLSYIAGVLEEEEEDTDVEEFISIMDAYVPEFGSLQPDTVSDWMMKVKALLSEVVVVKEPVQVLPTTKQKQWSRKNSRRQNSVSEAEAPQGVGSWAEVTQRSRHTSRSYSECSGEDQWPQPAESQRFSTQVSTETSQSTENELSDGIEDAESPSRTSSISEFTPDTSSVMDLLSDMFPARCSLDIEKAFAGASGDLEMAIMTLLEESQPEIVVPSTQRYQKTAVIKGNAKVATRGKRRKKTSQSEDCVPDDSHMAVKDIKDKILNKYSYMPTDADSKTHAPKLSTNDQKKMVRYREGQIVSTKGERFSQVKEPMTEEMKKTYVNLKPARKYRFH